MVPVLNRHQSDHWSRHPWPGSPWFGFPQRRLRM